MASRILSPLLAALLLALGGGAVGAQTISVSANPPVLRISTATAGSQPVAVSNATTTYTIWTGFARRQILGRINANMPAGTTLLATLNAPGSATSVGAVALDVTNRALVINIAPITFSTQAIRYDFSATTAAGVIPATSRTVTFTVVNYP